MIIQLCDFSGMELHGSTRFLLVYSLRSFRVIPRNPCLKKITAQPSKFTFMYQVIF